MNKSILSQNKIDFFFLTFIRTSFLFFIFALLKNVEKIATWVYWNLAFKLIYVI